MTKISVCGDTHGNLDLQKLLNTEITKDTEYMLHCGDFGCPWSNNWENSVYDDFVMQWVETLPYKLLVTPGNHENYKNIYNLPKQKVEYCDEEVYSFLSNTVFIPKCSIINLGGTTILSIGGATSIDKERRRVDLSWWEEEDITNTEIKRFTDKNIKEVDYIVTHTPPEKLIDIIYPDSPFKGKDPTAKFLQHVMDTISFKKWYFGHVHLDDEWTVDNKKFKSLYEKISKLGD